MFSRDISREKCELCHKFIYSHDVILVCSNDSKTYHAKCLKIDRDIAFEIQQTFFFVENLTVEGAAFMGK